MYPGNVNKIITTSKHNLKNVITDLKLNRIVVKFRHLSVSKTCKTLADARFEDAVQLFKKQLLSIPHSLKNESSNLLSVWSRQCECVLAQRIRRSQQMFSLYTKLWGEHALKDFLKNMRLQFLKRGKRCIFGAVGLMTYNWDKNRISEEELRSHLEEMDYIQLLKKKTMTCNICNKVPDNIDKTIIEFCECDKRKTSLNSYENWTVFIEQGDLIVWRRPHKSGCFEYKVYGSYNDVTAEDFLSVQIDTSYRKEWDTTAVELEIIEKDVIDSNSDVIYWEMQWPRLFSNRDYVFNRRFLVDKAKKMVMLLSKGTQHPKYPVKPNKHRVADYWSSMVIKPYSDINKPGIEFSLTYFDNPGVNIPASVTAWVAYRAMPDFLTRLREATKKYKNYCKDHNCESIYVYKPRPKWVDTEDDEECTDDDFQDEEILVTLLSNEKEQNSSQNDFLNKVPDNETTFNQIVHDIQECEARIVPSSAPDADIILSPSPIAQADQSYWKYLQPTYYLN